MRTPNMGDIVTVAIVVPVDVHAGSHQHTGHRTIEVPAVVTEVVAPVGDSEAWTIGATTFRTASHNHEQIYASITLYATAEDGRASENEQPVFAYARPETVATPAHED